MDQSRHQPPSASDCDSPPSWADTVAELQQQNQQLQQRLREITDTVAANEAVWRHFLEMERVIFCTRSFDRLVQELLGELKNRFEIDWLVLFLLHPEILERFFPELTDEGTPLAAGTWLIPVAAGELQAELSELTRPVVFQIEDPEMSRWLPHDVWGNLRSGVWVPIVVHQIVYGTLLLGSQNGERYRPGDSTDLLEQLGVKIALCMENCLIYEKIQDLSLHDPVTGLLNYSQAQSILEKEFHRARRNGSPLSLLLVDLDPFQHLELNFGHQTAADILRHGAEILRTASRGEDSVARYGSGEFLVILPNTDVEEAHSFAADFKHLLRKSPFSVENAVILLQANVGLAALDEAMEHAHDLLAAASTELYRGKLARLPRDA